MNNQTTKGPERRFLWVDDHSEDKNDDGSWLYLDHFTKGFRSVFPSAEIITAKNEDEAKEKLKVSAWTDGIILDLNLAGTERDDYLNLLKTLYSDHPNIPIIALTNMSFPDIMKGALNSGAKAIFDRSRSILEEGELISAYKLAAREMKKHLPDKPEELKAQS